MDFFTSQEMVKEIIAKGPTKSSVFLKNDMQADIRVVADDEFGAAVQYFTGSKEHNVKVRQIAIDKGFKLSEYGLFDRNTGKKVCGKIEEEIYKKLGMDFIAPELRENSGEIEAAISHKLPDLIPYDALKGDFHLHTEFSDGNNTVEELALEGKKLGYEYICITDHSQSLKIGNGLSVKELEKLIEQVRLANKKIKGIRIFAGTECDILKDGTLDYPDNVLKKLDIIIGSVHSGFKMSELEMTSRIVRALENKHLDILCHPTGRIINQRQEYAVNIEKIIDAAKANGKVLEINSFPDRLDLSDINARAAIKAGVKLAINTDSHVKEQMAFAFYGLAVARRAWAEEKDIVNAQPLKQLAKFFPKLNL
jgi:DNA polymerase (family X)